MFGKSGKWKSLLTYKKKCFFLWENNMEHTKYVPGKKVKRVKAIKKITYISGNLWEEEFDYS